MLPASTSSASHGGNRSSSSSNGKRNGNNYRYRTINAQSEVDETLFGTPHRLATAAKMRAERQQNPEQEDYGGKPHQTTTKQPGPAKKEFVRHITKDLIRDLMLVHKHTPLFPYGTLPTRDSRCLSSSVPEDLTCTSVIIDGSTYHRLAHAARFNPREVRDQELNEARHNRDSIEVRGRHLFGRPVVDNSDPHLLFRPNWIEERKPCKNMINNAREMLR